MKNLRFFVVALSFLVILSSCRLWNNIFRPKYGCPSDGKNVGAEKVLSGDPATIKALKKAKKFKS